MAAMNVHMIIFWSIDSGYIYFKMGLDHYGLRASVRVDIVEFGTTCNRSQHSQNLPDEAT